MEDSIMSNEEYPTTLVTKPDNPELKPAGDIIEKETAIIGIGHTEVSLERFDQYMAIVQRRAEKCVELREYIISQTTKEDWENMNGRPYLNVSGSIKASKLAMVQLDNVTGGIMWSKDEKGTQYYYYKYMGRFSIPFLGDSTYEIGRCSQRDQFFGTHKVPELDEKTGEEVKWPSGQVKMVKAFKPASEVEEGDIDRTAMTNLRVRGTRAITGVVGVTWEELERLAHITRDMVRSTDFADSKGGQGRISKAEMKQIFSLLKQHNVDVDEFQRHHNIKKVLELPQGQFSKAKAWIAKQGGTDATTASSEGLIAPAAIRSLRDKMKAVGMTDEQYKAQMGTDLENTKRTDFAKAEMIINKAADGAS
jgi:hypothetical protein